MRRLRSVTPEQWFLAAFVILLLVFVVVLMTEATSVGRGGR